MEAQSNRPVVLTQGGKIWLLCASSAPGEGARWKMKGGRRKARVGAQKHIQYLGSHFFAKATTSEQPVVPASPEWFQDAAKS